MRERLDQKYLKPQVIIFEKALKEWSFIFLFIGSPWMFLEFWGVKSIADILTGCVLYYFIGMIAYLPLRTALPSYLAYRKVIMGDENE